MAHETDRIDEVPSTADLAAVIAKLNELIRQVNHYWHPEDPETH